MSAGYLSNGAFRIGRLSCSCSILESSGSSKSTARATIVAGGVSARYVKLVFDGGAVVTGGVPNKWMLDEVTIEGVAEHGIEVLEEALQKLAQEKGLETQLEPIDTLIG